MQSRKKMFSYKVLGLLIKKDLVSDYNKEKNKQFKESLV